MSLVTLKGYGPSSTGCDLRAMPACRIGETVHAPAICLMLLYPDPQSWPTHLMTPEQARQMAQHLNAMADAAEAMPMKVMEVAA